MRRIKEYLTLAIEEIELGRWYSILRCLSTARSEIECGTLLHKAQEHGTTKIDPESGHRLKSAPSVLESTEFLEVSLVAVWCGT